MKNSPDGRIQFLVFFLIACVWFLEQTAKANLSGAEPGYAGAPGESTCLACHGQTTRSGTVSLTGTPTSYGLGSTYSLTVAVNTTGVRFGFEMTAIDSAGRRAGTLQSTTTTQLKTTNVLGNARQYIEHTSTGNSVSSWTFNWTAPSSAVGGITFYVAGLYANNQANTLGDTTYTTTRTSAAPPPPANDNFVNAVILSGNSANRTNTTVAATKESGEPNHAASAGGASVWYRWTAPSNGMVTLDTKGSLFNTLLAVYTGGTVSSLTGIASDDQSGGNNTSSLNFFTVAGTVYQIAVDGFSGASGTYILNLSFVPAPANDNFVNAQILSGNSVTQTGSNVAASKQSGEPNHAGSVGGASVWYRWTAISNGVVLLDTKGSLFNTLLAVYTGNAVSSLTSIASDDQSGGNNTSELSFTALAGTNYQLAIDGVSAATGAYVLNLNFLLPPRLSISLTQANALTISWPTAPPGFSLESVASLAASNNWITVTNPITVFGIQNLVMPSNISSRIFRLRRP
ncbi:MAG: choice-of-anchor V domain-containing protein [Verrucomicrobiota bacterium]